MSEMKSGLQWNTLILSAGPTSRRNLHCSVIYPQNSGNPTIWGSNLASSDSFSHKSVVQLTALPAGGRYPSFARRTYCRGRRGSGLAGIRLTSPLQSIRKYGQYHRPIARTILFWLDGDSFMSPGGTRASLRSGDLPPRRHQGADRARLPQAEDDENRLGYSLGQIVR